MTPIATNSGDMERQLQQWGAKLDELMANVEKAGAGTQVDYRHRVEDLKAKHRAVEVKLDEVRASGSALLQVIRENTDGVEGETLKVGVANAWGALEDAFKKLSN